MATNTDIPIKQPQDVDGPPMSEPDLRSAVQMQLRNSGVADDLKAHLRAKIIHHLNPPLAASSSSTTPKNIIACRSSSTPNAHLDLVASNLVRTLGNVLVADYLASHNLDYSLSVYLPETAQSAPPALGVSEVHELLRLNANPGSNALILCNEIGTAAAKSTSILEAIIRGIRESQFLVTNQHTQTDDDSTTKTIKEYTELVDKLQDDSKKALLEQARKYDTMFDERLTQELNRQVESFKTTEMKRIQVEARESVFTKIEQAKDISEKRHAENETRLRKEMDEIRKQAAIRETELESQLTLLRSKLQQQVQATQTAETTVRSQIDSQAHATLVELESTKRQVTDLQRRIALLTTERDDARNRVDGAIQSARLETSREHSDFVNKLKIQEAKLQAERQVVDERRQNLDRYLGEEKELKQELSQTRKLLDQAHSQILALQQKNAHDDRSSSNRVKNSPESAVARELKEMSAKMEDVFSRIQSAPPLDQIHSLRLSEQKWQHECQGLISRLEREYRRGDDLERQLMITKNAKSELKTEVMHLRVLLHQLSVSSSATHGPLDADTIYRFMPDPMIPMSSSTPSPSRLGHGRRSKYSSNRDNPAPSFGSDSEDGMPNAVEVSPTSRESLISDLSSAEMRILRTKPNDSVLGAGIMDSPRTIVDSTLRTRATNDYEYPRSASFGNRRSSSREVVIAPIPIICGEDPTSRNADRLADSSTPSDLSAPERKILSRRASRDILVNGCTPDHSYSLLGAAAMELGLAAGNQNGIIRSSSCSGLAVPNTQDELGALQPHDFSGSEIKILQRRASRELGVALDTGLGDAGHATRSSAGFHIVRTKSTESTLSDISAPELRLLSESASAHTKNPKSVADVDAAPHKVYMASQDAIVSDLSTTEKKLLVKNATSPSTTRVSVGDLVETPQRMSSIASASGTSSSHGNLSGGTHERKVVILARDEILCDEKTQMATSRESNVSCASARHVAFSTTDEEHEMDIHSIRRVAFGESEELIVEPRRLGADLEGDHRSRVVSFDELTSSDDQGESSKPGKMKATAHGLSLPTKHLTAGVNAATHLSPPNSPLRYVSSADDVEEEEEEAEKEQPNSLAAKAHAIASANPALLKYMDTVVANQGAPLIAEAKNESHESVESNEFGSGDTISAATGSTATGSSSK